MEIKEIKEKIVWENFLGEIEEKTFLQSWSWGEFQKMMGEKVWRFGIFENGNLIAFAQIIKIKAKRGSFLLVPHGPNIKNSKSEIPNSKSPLPAGSRQDAGQIQNSKFKILNTSLEELKKLAKEEKVDFIRIASIWEDTLENREIFKNLGFHNAPIYVHPELTWELDIIPSEQELLGQMRKTTRYLIRQGLKNEYLKIEKSQDIKDVEIFNNLYQNTVDRHHFIPFSFKYLRNEFLAFSKDNQALIFLAKYKKEYLSAAIIIFWQGIAFYHQGASSQRYPQIPASYLLQWEAIKEAKNRGCRIYNFWGIAPIFASAKMGNSKFQAPIRQLADKQIQNSKFKIQNYRHPWAGLTLFKTGFGGYQKEYVKTQDLPLSFKYWLTFFFEILRKKKRRL